MPKKRDTTNEEMNRRRMIRAFCRMSTGILSNEETAPSYTAYRYIRFQSNADNTTYRRYREIELYGETWGTDLTSPATTVTASGFAGAGEEPNKAVDNDTATQWASSTSYANSWLQVDFGAGNEQVIHGMAMYFFSNHFPFQLLGSNDGTNFDLLLDATNIPSARFSSSTVANNQIVVPARLYRLRATAGGATGYISVGRIELLNSQGVDLLTRGIPNVHWANRSQGAANELYTNVVDPSTSNDWTAADFDDATIYLGVESFDDVATLRLRSGVVGERAITDGVLEVSDDNGSSWSTVISFAGQTGWANNETRSFT